MTVRNEASYFLPIYLGGEIKPTAAVPLKSTDERTVGMHAESVGTKKEILAASPLPFLNRYPPVMFRRTYTYIRSRAGRAGGEGEFFA